MNQHDTGSELLWADGPPRGAWHSFNSTPWLHPWLTRRNLSAIREASSVWREEAKRVLERVDRIPTQFAFIGNIANGMYMRAKAIAQTGAQIQVFVLYGDESIFSDPRWEEYGGFLPTSVSYLASDKWFLKEIETTTPFYQFNVSNAWASMGECDLPSYASSIDFRRWRAFFADLPAFERLQSHDAVLACQKPYVAYLSGRPYAATVMGGDLWLEASRDDELGRLQRTAFARAGCVLGSNPWNYSHARRYGLTNFIQLPIILNENDYSPGPPMERARWEEMSGGNFFVLSTARADDVYKGSQIGLTGFAEFSRNFASARLVFVSWGKHIDRLKETAEKLGISDRIVFVPVCGKRKLVEYLRSADCLLDQFTVGYYGATAIEGAACGTPVIMRFEQDQYEPLFESGPPPFLNASSGTQVANALEFIARSPAERRRELSAKHRNWFMKSHSGKRWAADYFAILAALALGHHFSFKVSPLAAGLSPAEMLYHSEQLASAPTFPNYERTPLLEEHLSRIEDRLSSLATQLALQNHQIAEAGDQMSRLIAPIVRVRRLLGLRR